SKWSKYAFALKTGKDVALTRTPIQILTFLKHIDNVILIGEAPGVSVGSIPMLDVYTHLYDDLKEKREDKEVIPDESSLGWKADAHKNMPGYRELYNRFPNADWYVMIDDDTYVFMDNLDERLSQFDPSQPIYIGSANVFQGCDGVTRFGDGPAFAHGGSGIIVSKGAVQKILPILDKCIVKYKDCWAGDIRLGLCLRDAGILITGDHTFNRDPPHRKYGFTIDPCDRPSTFHHLLVDQIQSLYELEMKSKTPLINYAQVFQHWHGDNDGKIVSGNRKGNDYNHVKSSSAPECRDLCEKDKKCASFVYDKGECWFKGRIPGFEESTEAKTGHFSSHYQC
ncbi:hypothetical protein EDD86DRAFT_182583, partial [Gorgonomyces haynaldii]